MVFVSDIKFAKKERCVLNLNSLLFCDCKDIGLYFQWFHVALKMSEGFLEVTPTIVNPFSTNVPLLYHLKQKISGFLMFSGGIEAGHWLKMG